MKHVSIHRRPIALSCVCLLSCVFHASLPEVLTSKDSVQYGKPASLPHHEPPVRLNEQLIHLLTLTEAWWSPFMEVGVEFCLLKED